MKIINTYRVRLFEAHREVCIVLACKERGLEDYDVEVRMLRPRTGYRWAAARQKGYYVPSTQLNEKIWHLEPPEVMSVYYKIQSCGVPISEWPIKVVSGIKLRRYISKVTSRPQEGTDWIGIIKGRDIQKYFHKSPSFWIPKSAIPSISQAGDKPRIIFSKLNAEIGFVLAAPYIYGDETTYILELIDYDEKVLYYLLGILNSVFFDWSFKRFYAGGGIEGEVKLYAFKQFPIPKIETNRRVADKIIEMVKLIYDTSITKYSSVVENFVLELYDLKSECLYIYLWPFRVV
jgi:hypothetical protein